MKYVFIKEKIFETVVEHDYYIRRGYNKRTKLPGGTFRQHRTIHGARLACILFRQTAQKSVSIRQYAH